jgi:branched-chain amino acid transport system substrate-binding protein
MTGSRTSRVKKAEETTMKKRRNTAIAAACLLVVGFTQAAIASEFTGPGVSPTEIRIGNTAPYSGPVSGLGVTIKAAAAYFKKLNDEGGVNGRKINFLSYDDGYNPSKTVEQTRKLVESDDVLLMFGSLGTPTNAAVQRYLNDKKIPQLFVMTGASRFHDAAVSPWSMGWPLALRDEGRVLAHYLGESLPNAKAAVLYQNDDFGRDVLNGLKDALGPKASNIIAESSYDVGAPTVDSQLVQLKSSGAEVLIAIATPKFAAQAIRKIAEIGWKPTIFIPQASASVGSVLKPAGLENSQGIVSWASYKDPTDPNWKDDAGMKEWLSFMERYYPDGDKTDISNVVGYLLAQTLVATLRQAGDDLRRDNVLKQAASLKAVELGMLLPGIRIDTVRSAYTPISQVQMQRFAGASWERFGSIVSPAPAP